MIFHADCVILYRNRMQASLHSTAKFQRPHTATMHVQRPNDIAAFMPEEEKNLFLQAYMDVAATTYKPRKPEEREAALTRNIASYRAPSCSVHPSTRARQSGGFMTTLTPQPRPASALGLIRTSRDDTSFAHKSSTTSSSTYGTRPSLDSYPTWKSERKGTPKDMDQRVLGEIRSRIYEEAVGLRKVCHFDILCFFFCVIMNLTQRKERETQRQRG